MLLPEGAMMELRAGAPVNCPLWQKVIRNTCAAAVGMAVVVAAILLTGHHIGVEWLVLTSCG